MPMWMFLAAVLLMTAEISISQKNTQCSVTGDIKIESHHEQRIGSESCAAASITRVQICEDGKWMAICGEKSSTANTKVLCRAEGYSTIGANFIRLSQVIGSEISSFRLNCNGSETNPDDCLVKNRDLVTSHCQRTVIRCFLTDPDPQLCNISLSKTLPGNKTTASDHTDTTEASITPLLGFTTTGPLPASTTNPPLSSITSTDLDTKKITIVPTIGIVIAAITTAAAIICFAAMLMIICLCLKHKKNISQSESSKQKQKELQMFDDVYEHTFAEYKQESKRENRKSICQYTNNEAYGSRSRKIDYFYQRPEGITSRTDDALSGDQHQEVEPIYETILDPTLKIK